MTRANEWRERAAEQARAEAVELDLPSGAKVLARRPSPMQLAVWGRLPLHLVESPNDGQVTPEISASEAADVAKLMRDLLVYCLVDPRVSEEPGDDVIHPREIPQEDWAYIMSWAMRTEVLDSLRPFRTRRTDGGRGGDGETIRTASIDIAGHRGADDRAGVRPGRGRVLEPGEGGGGPAAG